MFMMMLAAPDTRHKSNSPEWSPMPDSPRTLRHGRRVVQAGIANPKEGWPTGSMKKPECTYHKKICIGFAKNFARQHEKSLYSCFF
jgi:hypothetical protein